MAKNGSFSAYSIDRAKKAIAYIDFHYKEPLSAETIAEEFAIDTRNLQLLIQLLTGKTLHDYHIEVRIEKSKKDLALFDIPLKGVAASHGFSSANHFIRTFKKKTGLTPGQYRLQLVDPVNLLK